MARNREIIKERNRAIFERFIHLRVVERKNKWQAIDAMVEEKRFWLTSRTIHNIIFAKKFKKKRRVLAKQHNLFEID